MPLIKSVEKNWVNFHGILREGSSFPCYKKVIVILLEYIVHTTKRKPIVIYKIYEVTYTQHDSIIYLAYLQTWMNMIGIHLNIY